MKYADLIQFEPIGNDLEISSVVVRVHDVPDAGYLAELSVGNTGHELVKIGKAGRSRWLGRRPHQRGVLKHGSGQRHARRLARLGTRNVLDFEPKGYVLQGGSPRQKHIVLQHVADALRRAALPLGAPPRAGRVLFDTFFRLKNEQ